MANSVDRIIPKQFIPMHETGTPPSDRLSVQENKQELSHMSNTKDEGARQQREENVIKIE